MYPKKRIMLLLYSCYCGYSTICVANG